MNPDCSFVLYFKPDAKTSVIKSLGAFCINTKDFRFDAGLIANACSVSFVVNPEPALVGYIKWYEISTLVKGKILIGSIQLWIKNEKIETDTNTEVDVVSFIFWPVSSGINKACLASGNLKTSFIQLLKENKGIIAYIDNADGSVDILWENKQALTL